MAATLWRALLACELAIAITVALLAVSAMRLDRWLIVPIALAVLLLTQHVLVAASIRVSRRRAGPEPATGAATRALLSEGLYFGLAQLAMIATPRERSPEVDLVSTAQSERPVLLVHGLACNSGVWRWLLQRLRAAGFERVHCLELQPVRADIERFAGMVEREVLRIQRACAGSRVTVICHSMGGLAARAVLASLGPEVIRHIITLGTPHHGTACASVLSWPAAKQICVGSNWLAALNATQEGHLRVPLTSIYSLDDNLVRPARSARLRGARWFELRGLGHFGLLVSPRALDQVMTVLQEAA